MKNLIFVYINKVLKIFEDNFKLTLQVSYQFKFEIKIKSWHFKLIRAMIRLKNSIRDNKCEALKIYLEFKQIRYPETNNPNNLL